LEKGGFFKGVGQFRSNFRVEGDVPTNFFARMDRPYNFVADGSHIKKL